MNDTKEKMAVGAFLSAMHEQGLDGAKVRQAMLEFLGVQPAEAKPQWLPIETAPKNGTELIGWREDCGPLLIRWTSCSELMTDFEIEASGIDEKTLFAEDWFYADIFSGGRLEGSEIPTHWMPLPPPPNIGAKEQ